MYSLLEIFYFSIFNVLNSIKYPHYWICVFISFLQYSKIGKIEKDILGTYKRPPLLNTFYASFYGLFGGILGSMIFVYLKVIIDQRDFMYMLPLSLLLSMIHPRLICFSYSGGIISLISLLTRWPSINVTGIMFVVGILHLVESALVLLDGTRTKVPVFIERKGKLAGGYTLNSFWPVPFTIYINGGIPRPTILLAILGYGDYTLSNYPSKKAKESASLLFTFSMILITLARLSVDYSLFKYISAIFSPLAHEIIIALGKHNEKSIDDINNSIPNGIRVFEVLPNTIGKKMGISPGDIILSINGKRILSPRDLESIIYYKPKIILAKVFNMKKGVTLKEYISNDESIDNLGLIVVPNEPEYTLIEEESKSTLLRAFNKFSQKKLTFKN